ncbi:MAG: NAD(P)/FAD-dependent oxidoreductase [Anaerolineae bacterium]|nr:NAD(P)/FAD-dependent oxidoreductase [Anaerolineae bacterium]
MDHEPHVVIVGAGFGGLWAARAFAKAPVRATLIDRNNYHGFWPLLYQVAAAELDAEQIGYPVRRILRRHRNVRFFLGEVTEVDFDAKRVQAGEQTITYDYLVLALGSTSSYFNIPGAEAFTFPLKTMEEGIHLRNHILRCFEQAMQEQDPEVRQRLLTFVVAGGGPTGVEYAGALSELIQGPLAKDYPHLDLQEVSPVLVEMTDRLLGAMPEKLGRYALERLRRKGVEVRLNTAVSEVRADAVYFEDGSCLASDTVVWTAGVRGHPLAEQWGLPVGRGRRVEVEPTLQVPGQPCVYAIGDLVAFPGEDGAPLPMLAPVAMQQGEHSAANILRQIEGKEPQPFHYRDKGTMATIGRSAAVAHLRGISFTGFVAWIIWLVVHLFQLIGFRNRLVVLINWAWSYLFFERAVRLILPRSKVLEVPGGETRE